MYYWYRKLIQQTTDQSHEPLSLKALSAIGTFISSFAHSTNSRLVRRTVVTQPRWPLNTYSAGSMAGGPPHWGTGSSATTTWLPCGSHPTQNRTARCTTTFEGRGRRSRRHNNPGIGGPYPLSKIDNAEWVKLTMHIKTLHAKFHVRSAKNK